jgi:hypothetical protein
MLPVTGYLLIISITTPLIQGILVKKAKISIKGFKSYLSEHHNSFNLNA